MRGELVGELRAWWRDPGGGGGVNVVFVSVGDGQPSCAGLLCKPALG